MDYVLHFIGVIYVVSTIYCAMLTVSESVDKNRSPVTYNYMLCGFAVAAIPLFNTVGMGIHLFGTALDKTVFWR